MRCVKSAHKFGWNHDMNLSSRKEYFYALFGIFCFLPNERSSEQLRRFLGVICYILTIAADCAAAYYCYLTYKQTISYHQGFLTFTPIFITTYWFSTFYAQLLSGEDKKGRRLINKTVKRILSDILTLISAALLGFWVYIYFSRALYSTF